MSDSFQATGRVPLVTRDFVLACLSYCAFFFNYYLVVPVLPLYILAKGGTEAEVGLVVGAFMVSSIVVRFFIGRAVDAHAKSLFLVAGAVVYVVAALLYNVANTVPSLFALRLFHGAGFGLFVTAAFAMIADLAPAARRAQAMSYFGTSSNVAMALGPVAAIVLLQRTDYATVFNVAALLALIALPLIFRIKVAGKRPAPASGPSGPLLSRQALRPSAIALLMFLSYGGLFSFLPLYTERYGLGNPGIFFTAYAVSVTATRLLGGGLADRFSRASVMIPSLLAMAAGLGVLLGFRSIEALIVAGLLCGAGIGSTVPALMASVADQTREGQRGVAMGMIGAAFDGGVALGGIVLGVVLQVAGFEAMFLGAMIGTLAALALVVTSGPRQAVPCPQRM